LASFVLCAALVVAGTTTTCARQWHGADGALYCEGKLLSVENAKLHVLADTGAQL
jgi:hypothetical protein